VSGRDSFASLGTLGVEEEYHVVDAETLEPAPASDVLLAEDNVPPELEDHVGTELFKFVFETTTEVAENVEGARDEVERKRSALVEHGRDHGYEVLGAGLHPSARWDEHEHVKGERYRDQLERIQYPQHRNITAGLHVHVGLDDADKAVWVADEIRRYLPLILALSANSPFWYGRDTGLSSARAVVFENLPNTGIPSSFGDWEKFRGFEKRMVEEGTIRDRGEIWWDVRPHTEYGTVEVRSPDAQTDVDRVVASVALVRALVLGLAERYEEGDDRTRLRRELLEENKWRALRHGHDATFMRPQRDTVGVEELLGEVVDGFSSSYTEEIEGLLEESGASRQRRAHEDDGMRGVLESIRLP